MSAASQCLLRIRYEAGEGGLLIFNASGKFSNSQEYPYALHKLTITNLRSPELAATAKIVYNFVHKTQLEIP